MNQVVKKEIDLSSFGVQALIDQLFKQIRGLIVCQVQAESMLQVLNVLV